MFWLRVERGLWGVKMEVKPGRGPLVSGAEEVKALENNS